MTDTARAPRHLHPAHDGKSDGPTLRDVSRNRLESVPFPREKRAVVVAQERLAAAQKDAVRATRKAAYAVGELRAAIEGVPEDKRADVLAGVKKVLAFLGEVDEVLTGEGPEDVVPKRVRK